jgi:hypothetical protein
MVLVRFSPACIVALFGVGIVRGELGEAWKWIDDGTSDKSKKRIQ